MRAGLCRLLRREPWELGRTVAGDTDPQDEPRRRPPPSLFLGPPDRPARADVDEATDEETPQPARMSRDGDE